MAFIQDPSETYGYELGEHDRHPMRTFWRVLHLLGNAWVHNTLVDLGRRGLTFLELRFFLCTDAPAPEKVDAKLREVKRTLSDEPAVGFHLPPYGTTAQLSGDLEELAKLGYLVKVGDEWCLRLSAYEDLVNEWERDRDVRMIQGYGGGDLVRHGHHARIYGIPRSLLTPEEVRRLEEYADVAVWLAAGAFQVYHRAKVRTWRETKEMLESDALPRSVSSRILNLFWFWENDWVHPDRPWQPDTPRLITSEMVRLKDSQLMRRVMQDTIDEKALIRAEVEMKRKYVNYSSLPPPRETKMEFEIPHLAPEPPFATSEEETLCRDICEYLGRPDFPEGERAKRLEDLVKRGAPEGLLRNLRQLWASAITNATIVVTSPKIPLAENPTVFITEKEFFDRVTGRAAPLGGVAEAQRDAS